MSKFRSVTRALPKNLIEEIGRAPNIGRPRWLELTSLIKDDMQLATVGETLSADKVQSLSSDERFMVCLLALSGEAEAKPKAARKPGSKFADVGEVTFGNSDVRIKVAKKNMLTPSGHLCSTNCRNWKRDLRKA